jgi:hypothetical protein
MTPHARHGLTQARRSQPAGNLIGIAYPLLMVWIVIAMGLVLYSPRDVRLGAALAGAGMLVAAVARIVLPARSAGMLATRQRFTDAATIAVLGLGMLVLGVSLPPPA